ncbi:hypothetical protein ACFL3U_01815 [Pseudomonadota bacterium]
MDKDQYFFRAVIYAIQKDKVLLVDMKNPKASTPLDPWLGRVVGLADGQHTVQELIDFLASQYPGGAPENLADTVESVIKRLKETHVIHLSDEPVELPYYLATPANEQDPEKAKELIEKDGFIAP